ncbi:leu operon leader peptide [Escherichia coli]
MTHIVRFIGLLRRNVSSCAVTSERSQH